MACQLKYDSVHEQFAGTIAAKETNGGQFLVLIAVVIQIFHERDPAAILWGAAGVEYTYESRGVFTTKKAQHLMGGVKKVIVFVPSKDAVPTYEVDVSRKRYEVADTMVLNASCTTICLTLMTTVEHGKFDIVEGLMTMVHAMIAMQLTVGGPSHGGKDWGGGRCVSQNIISSSIGAAQAVGKVLLAVGGKFSDVAFRVLMSDVSAANLACRSERLTKYDDIVAALEEYAAGDMKGVPDRTEDEVVLMDSANCKSSLVFDVNMGALIGRPGRSHEVC